MNDMPPVYRCPTCGTTDPMVGAVSHGFVHAREHLRIEAARYRRWSAVSLISAAVSATLAGVNLAYVVGSIMRFGG
jgi:hypothetical protein